MSDLLSAGPKQQGDIFGGTNKFIQTLNQIQNPSEQISVTDVTK